MTPEPKRKVILSLIGMMIIIDIIILDQLTKWAVLEMILRPALEHTNTTGVGFFEWLHTAPERLGFVSVELTSFFNWVMVWNKGVSFGLMQGDTPVFLIIATGAISLIFVLWLMRVRHWLPMLSLAFVVGGALGNIIDRLRFGAVADFLDFHAFGYHFPAFNLADSCITVGIALLVLDGLFFEPRRNKG
jgi:signal peptidase II